MVDPASCAVAALTGGLWSALLPLNPLKQPYTKPKSPCIPRKVALFSATAPVKVTVPPVRHSFSVCPGTCRTLEVLLDLHFPQQIHQCPGHLGHYCNSQNSEPTRGMDLHELSNMRKSPYRRIYPRLQLRCFSRLLPVLSHYLLSGWYPGSLICPKNQPFVFKKRFLAFTCHPLSLLCEPQLWISFAWVSIQYRSK